jgi:hypothetical protein
MATGTSTRVPAPAFHADDTEENTNYRSLSVTALIALLFGLASPLCFGHILLMLIPLIGIVFSILALRQIADSDGALAGRGAAVAGLVLCVGFGVAPFARALVLRTTRTSQAEDFGLRWIQSVAAGKTEHAFRLTADSTRRAPPSEPGAPAPTQTPYELFLDQPLVKALVSAGADAEIRFEGTTGYEAPSFQRIIVRQKYAIAPKSAGGDATPVEAILTLQRAKLSSEGRSRWLVVSLTDANQPAGHDH